MTGYPDMMTVGWLVPMARNLFIFSSVVMPFRADPDMMSTRPDGAFDYMFMRPFPYIIMLGARIKRGEGKGGSKEDGNH